MSAPSHVQRCRLWIREQIDAMGTLRTSNSRDLNFKSWRQNTVTVLQRIWPDDQERVERFRRIVFTPPHSRADAKLSREWFGKGLGESRTYLQSILDIIDREGVPEPCAADRDDDSSSLEDEVGFPMLDLDEEAGTTEPPDAFAPQEEPAGGLGVTPGYTTPDEQGATPRDPRTPAPPTLSMHWKAPTPSGLRRRDTLSPDTPPALGESSAGDAKPRARDDRPAVQIPRAPSLAPAEEPVEPVEAEDDAVAEPEFDEPVASEPEAPAKPAAPAPRLTAPRPGMTVAPTPAEPAKPVVAAPRPGMTVASKPAEPAKPVVAAPRPGMTVASKPAEPAKPAVAAPRPGMTVASKPAEPAKPAAAAPKPAAPAASKPAEPARPAAAAPAAPRPPAAEKPTAPAPPTEARTEPGSRVEARGKSGRGKQPKKSGPRPKLKDLLGLSEFDSRTPDEFDEIAADLPVEESAPEPAVTPPPAGAEQHPAPTVESFDDEPLPVEDEEDRERATLDFMQNSPVFGLVGKPVHRRTDTTEFLDPDAVAVATLAADLGRLGVPEAMRASIAARLLDVAKRLEDGGLDWALLRGTVTDAMQYPDLAKRLLPVLLPWLERAA